MEERSEPFVYRAPQEIWKKTRRKGELMIEIKKKGHDSGRGGNILYFGDDDVLEIEEARNGDPDCVTLTFLVLGRLVDLAC